MSRTLLWIDGVNSAVMGHFALLENPDAIPVHCDLGDSVHEDSHRFINDLEQWYGKPIVRVRSAEYATIDEVFEKRAYVYDIGMPNGNCLCCVKSSSPNYWAHQRKWFPEVFARRNAQARKLGARLVILRQEKVDGKRRNVRGFPDEIPADQSTIVRAADFGGCGFHCAAPLSPRARHSAELECW